MTDLQVVSTFSGIGGIDRGLELAGASTALMCELDPHARKILARHYPHAAIHNDVTELTADDCRTAGAVPERTILTAGFPCQDLSVAGRRRGMGQGTRSGLYWHVDRLLAEFRPAWVILENVPGLLSAACPCPGDGTCSDTCPGELHAIPGGICDGGCVNVHGGTMGAVLGSLAQRGYGFAYRVLDARHFGVPQRRRRVVIVGRLGDTGAAAAQVLLEPEGVPGNPAKGISPRPLAPGFAGSGFANRGLVGLDPWNITLTGDISQTIAGASRENRLPHVVGVLGDHTRTLTAEGHDASEDGTGRGVPIIAFSHTAGIDILHSTTVTPTIKAGHDATPSVAYVADEVSTLQAAGGERGYRIDAEAAAGGQLVAMTEGELHADATQTHAGEVLHRLRDALGAEGLREWGSRVLTALQSPAVLQQGVHAGGLQTEAEDLLGELVHHAQASAATEAGWSVRALRECKEDRRASRRWELAEQLAGELEASLSQLPLADAPRVIVRRLTPLELERLQGFPDGWTEGQSDTHRSKQLGNSVAVPVFEWVGRRLVAVDSALEVA